LQKGVGAMNIDPLMYSISIFILSYIASNIFRLILKKKFCTKCSALIFSILILFLFKYPTWIIALFAGALFTILAYYLDYHLREERKIKIIIGRTSP